MAAILLILIWYFLPAIVLGILWLMGVNLPYAVLIPLMLIPGPLTLVGSVTILYIRYKDQIKAFLDQF